jgi:adenylylsulfate kinase-like enzyme
MECLKKLQYAALLKLSKSQPHVIVTGGPKVAGKSTIAPLLTGKS